MFSVYGETGRLFKGAMEELRQVEAVRAVSRLRAIDPVGRFQAPGPRPQDASPAAAGHRAPLAAYAQTASPQARRQLTRVAEVMSHGVITVQADAPVLQAWKLLAEKEVGQAPAVDARGQLVGLLARADLLTLERLPIPGTDPLAWQALLARPVSDLMWTPVPAVARETDIRHVARVLLDTHLPGLPVVNDAGMVEGFVSRTDILRAVVHDPPLDLWT